MSREIQSQKDRCWELVDGCRDLAHLRAAAEAKLDFGTAGPMEREQFEHTSQLEDHAWSTLIAETRRLRDMGCPLEAQQIRDAATDAMSRAATKAQRDTLGKLRTLQAERDLRIAKKGVKA